MSFLVSRRALERESAVRPRSKPLPSLTSSVDRPFPLDIHLPLSLLTTLPCRGQTSKRGPPLASTPARTPRTSPRQTKPGQRRPPLPTSRARLASTTTRPRSRVLSAAASWTTQASIQCATSGRLLDRPWWRGRVRRPARTSRVRRVDSSYRLTRVVLAAFVAAPPTVLRASLVSDSLAEETTVARDSPLTFILICIAGRALGEQGRPSGRAQHTRPVSRSPVEQGAFLMLLKSFVH